MREDLRQAFPNSNSTDATASECAAVCMREPSTEPVPDRVVFDSHFHLDRLQWSLNLPQDTSFQQTMAALGRIPEDYQVDIAGCTAVFCDIPFYPSPERTNALSSDAVSVAIGVHPKAPTLTEEEEMKFLATFNHPNVVALGKICLDYKVSKGAKIRNRYNLVPHLTQDTNGKVTNSQ